MIKFNQEDIIVVTGGSSGLGREICLRVNSLGATVIAVARNEERLNQAKEESDFPDNFVVVSKDLSVDFDSIPKFVKELAKKFGKLKGLVHAAGVLGLMPLRGIRIQKTKAFFDINYFAGLALAKGFADRRTCSENASIVYISSIAAVTGHLGQIEYGSSKGAVNSLVRTLAIEVAKQNTRVNSVMPAHVVTEMTESFDDIYSEEYKHELKTMYPLGLGKPEDVANLVVFLLSDVSKWITGQNIIIDGGRTLI
ncbi:MAG: SDR family oxidoreductase [Desulfobacteraceae bacterium]|nr:SDR family oxidoreductase [Desulfobacteraceae bacterium]